MNQDAFGREAGLGHSHNVLDGDPVPPSPKGHSPPNLWLTSIVAKRSPISATVEHLFIRGAIKSGTLLAHAVFDSVKSSSRPSR